MAKKIRSLYVYEVQALEDVFDRLQETMPYLTVKRIKEIGPAESIWLTKNKIQHIVEYKTLRGFSIFFKTLNSRNYFMLSHSETWKVI